MNSLPLELEREIFEWTALLYPETIPRLMLVAHRTSKWMEPLLYRIIRLDDSNASLGYAIENKSLKFLSAYVRYAIFEEKNSHLATIKIPQLVVHDPATPVDAADIFAVCPRITRVALNGPYFHHGRLSSSPLNLNPAARNALAMLPELTHLSASLWSLFQSSTQNYTLLDAMSAHPSWNTLTHLSLYDLFVFQMREQIWDMLPRMPRLTHLRMPMFSKDAYTLPAVHEVVGLLYASPRLQVLVLSVNGAFPIDHWQVQPTAGQDPRLVWAVYASLFEDRVLREDWLRGARGLVDTWVLAEEQVRRQRANPGVTGRIAVPE